LKRRLSGRATDDRAIIRRRLTNARREIQDVIQYDYYIVNSDIQEAVRTLEAIILAERQKISRVTAWGIAPLRRPAKSS
jgi:guanylate kinase